MSARIRAAGLVFVGLLSVTPASAQVVHSIQFGGGLFFPRGFDTRADNDVLVRNHLGQPLPGDPTLSDALLFDFNDFRSGHVFGEWTMAFGDHVEIGAGLGYQRQTVPSIYRDIVDENFYNVEQALRLQIVPLTAVVRFLPFGRPGTVQPYVGAGAGALMFRYSEFGRFVDEHSLEVYEDRYTAAGVAPGAVLLGGVRFPIGGDIYALSFEGRYLWGVGDTGGADEGFVADKIDLSGGLFNVAFQIRF